MRFKAKVSYDGHEYQGWAKQPGKNTVQGNIERALKRLTSEDISIQAAGRTDRGVHAYGQIFHFDCNKEFRDIARSINSQLPASIRIVSCEAVSDEFHSRFDAKWKHYRYLINTGKFDPIMRNYLCQLNRKLDVEAMKKASEVFLGEHDFTSFNATGKSEIEDQVRNIYRIDIKEKGNILSIDYYGDGFLRYMVRMLTGALIAAGSGRTTPEELKEILKKRDKTACNFNTDACGLYLIEIGYTIF